jgi:hypothetical protein
VRGLLNFIAIHYLSTALTMSPRTKTNEDEPFLEYTDDASTGEPDRNPPYHHVKGRNSVFTNFLIIIVTSLFWIMVLLALSRPVKPLNSSSKAGDRHNITTNAKLLTCGNSTQEAKALGCKYDVLLNHWVAAPCLDEDWIAEYEDDGSWAAFADENMTQQIKTVEEMSEREFYYTSVRDHINHCGTMWKKQFWALYREQTALDSLIASPGHTDHCAHYLMDIAMRNETEPTKVEIGFAGCWIRQGNW